MKLYSVLFVAGVVVCAPEADPLLPVYPPIYSSSYPVGFGSPLSYTAVVPTTAFAFPSHAFTSYNSPDQFTAVSVNDAGVGPKYVAENHGTRHVVHKRDADAQAPLLYVPGVYSHQAVLPNHAVLPHQAVLPYHVAADTVPSHSVTSYNPKHYTAAANLPGLVGPKYVAENYGTRHVVHRREAEPEPESNVYLSAAIPSFYNSPVAAAAATYPSAALGSPYAADVSVVPYPYANFFNYPLGSPIVV